MEKKKSFFVYKRNINFRSNARITNYSTIKK